MSFFGSGGWGGWGGGGTVLSDVTFKNDISLYFGTLENAALEWNTSQTQDAFAMALDDTNATLLIGTKANIITNNRDLTLAANTNPQIVVTSATSWGSATDQWVRIYYDPTANSGTGAGIIDTGTGPLILQDEVISTSHIRMGNSDQFSQGNANNYVQQFDGTDETITFAAMAADTHGAGYYVTMPAAGAVTSGQGFVGGFVTYALGAGGAGFAGSDNAGGAAGDFTITGAIGGAAASGGGATAGGTGSSIFFTLGLGGAGAGGGSTGDQGTFTINGPVAITPATAAVGLTVELGANDVAGIRVNSDHTGASNPGIYVTGKFAGLFTQDVANGYGLAVDRNIAEVGANPLASFIDEDATVTQALIYGRTDGTTNILDLWGGAVNALTLTNAGVLTLSGTAEFSGVTGTFSTEVQSPLIAPATAVTMTVQNNAFSAADSAVELSTGTWTHSSGIGTAVTIKPTINSSGTSSWRGLVFDITTTSVGSAANYFIWCDDDAATKFAVRDDGLIFTDVGVVTNSGDTTLLFQQGNFTSANSAVKSGGGTYSHSSGTCIAFEVNPTWNSSGTAAQTALLINSISTAVGSGAYLLLDCKDDTSSVLSISSTGSINLLEKASADTNVATFGQLWVKNAAPSQLWFTDDDGNDQQIAAFDVDSAEMIITAGKTVTMETADTPIAVYDISTGSVADWTFTTGLTAAITVYADYSGTVTDAILVTAAGHGLATGDIITIRGTTAPNDYNGVWQVTVISASQFYFVSTGLWNADAGASAFEMGGYLTPDAGAEGEYTLDWNMSITKAAGSSAETTTRVYQDITEQAKARRQRTIAGTDTGAVAGGCHITVSAGQRIWLALESDNTNNLVIQSMTIRAHRLT